VKKIFKKFHIVWLWRRKWEKGNSEREKGEKEKGEKE